VRRLVSFAVLAVIAAGCGRDRRAWEAELGAVGAGRLAGVWAMRMEINQPRGSAARPPLVGTIAFTLNTERLHGSGTGGPPMLFGTYSMDFVALGLAVGTGENVPEAAAFVRADSVTLTLAPGSLLPMELSGMIRGDSVVGSWRVTSRSRPTSEGVFTMTRRP
jgi:hypothetical protein